MSNSMSLAAETWTTSTCLPLPTRNWPTLSGLPMVALRPIIWGSSSVSSRTLSRAMLSWLPLLLSASSWISSMTIHLAALR